jgi:hypothetical protein
VPIPQKKKKNDGLTFAQKDEDFVVQRKNEKKAKVQVRSFRFSGKKKPSSK